MKLIFPEAKHDILFKLMPRFAQPKLGVAQNSLKKLQFLKKVTNLGTKAVFLQRSQQGFTERSAILS